MPWNLILTTLVPMLLNPSHPQHGDAHAAIASAAFAGPKPAPSAIVDTLMRVLALEQQAQAISGAAPTPTSLAIQALVAALNPAPAA